MFVDHINRVGDVDAGFIERMFVPSNKLQGLCHKCHGLKTKQERKLAKTQEGLHQRSEQIWGDPVRL